MTNSKSDTRAWPIAGGVSVLVITGLVGFQEFLGSGSVSYRIAGVAFLLIMLLGAWLLAKFVKEHGGEIGEARFDTRNKDDLNG